MTKRSIWFSLRASLWLMPLLALAVGALAALLLVQLDLRFAQQLNRAWPELLLTGPDGARQILATIGSSMITVAGVVFSITIVSLSLTANQYSPRVLRNFMRDTLNQTVLGVFVAVFIYSLLVLQAVGSPQPAFVPQLALWTGLLLALVSIGFLIAFIHHTATSIQVSEIVERITAETVAAFKAVRHIANEGSGVAVEPDECVHTHWQTVNSKQSGYVQDVDVARLFKLACERQLMLRVECAVGDFVVAGRPLVTIVGACQVERNLVRQIHALFGINSYRTIEQDPAFGVRQIVDIALRALSPGINDATTAINCVDYLAVILHCACQARWVPEVHCEREVPRLFLRQLTPEHLMDIALHEIRQNASGNVAVLLRLQRLLRQLREDIDEAPLRAHLRRHAYMVDAQAQRSVPAAEDRAELSRALQRTLAAQARRKAQQVVSI